MNCHKNPNFPTFIFQPVHITDHIKFCNIILYNSLAVCKKAFPAVGVCFEGRISLRHSMQRQHEPEIFSEQPHRTLARLSIYPLCLSRELFEVMGALQQRQQKLCAISKQTPTAGKAFLQTANLLEFCQF
jgi:hypothetical protein